MDPRIRVVLRIIEERKGLTPLVSKDTGKLLGLSEAHFLRLFHRQVGITFKRYLRQIRMNRAAELLKNPAIAIKGIASDCGYNDISNFYRDFKQVHGINPRQARFALLLGAIESRTVGAVTSALLQLLPPVAAAPFENSTANAVLTINDRY
jgi:AraC-like DNA-binding protein